jgi:hypothetical protein
MASHAIDEREVLSHPASPDRALLALSSLQRSGLCSFPFWSNRSIWELEHGVPDGVTR